MNTKIKKYLWLIISLLMLLVAGCGGSTQTSHGSGGIVAKLQFVDSGKSAGKVVASAPANVATITVAVSGSGISTIQKSFLASAGTGSIAGIPASSGLTVTFQGLDASDNVLYAGTVTNVTVNAGQNTELGSIVMKNVYYTVLGSVKSGGVGVSGASVLLSGTNGSGSVITDSLGNYSFSYVNNGNYNMYVSKAGFTFASQSVVVTGANVVMGDFNADIPFPPTGVTAAATSSSQINLAWTDSANTGSTAYKIERKTGVDGTYAQIAVTGANVTSYSDTGLTAATAYYYRVRSSNNVGDSGFATEVFTTTTTSSPSNVLTDATTGMVLQKVPGGTFTMGDTFGDGWSGELPTHQVTLSDFYIGKYEVTQGQWVAVMGSNPSYFSACGLDCPVDSVSWDDIQTFITQLNQLSGKNYRLPTEAEWEYAARSGGQHEEYSGGSNVDAVAWYWTNSNNTPHQVGTKQANGLGLYDMSGNAVEWVNDWYGAYGSSSQTNPTGPTTGSFRVFRGGSWIDDAFSARAAFRLFNSPDLRNVGLGFRLASPVQ